MYIYVHIKIYTVYGICIYFFECIYIYRYLTWVSDAQQNIVLLMSMNSKEIHTINTEWMEQ